MHLKLRIGRLEREVVLDATTGQVGRRCRVCDDGAKLSPVAIFDGVPAPWHRGRTGDNGAVCVACGRESEHVVDVIGIDPNAL